MRNPQTKKTPNATYLKDILKIQVEGTTVLWEKMNFGSRCLRMNQHSDGLHYESYLSKNHGKLPITKIKLRHIEVIVP